MSQAAVRILHPEPAEDSGELARLLARARAAAAEQLAARFRAAGGDDVRIVGGPPDERSFGARLREIAAGLERGDGLVVLGSGSIPLASEAHVAELVGVARSGAPHALTNNRYSSDVVAIGDASILATVPDLPADNALPAWLVATAGVRVDVLADRDRLGLDLDSPADLELLRRHPDCPNVLVELARTMSHHLARVSEALDELAALARNAGGELLVAGRLSAAGLRRLEDGTACRIRAFVEERGLRTAASDQRPPAAALGLLLDREGPEAVGMLVARLADGAILDSRVLLAHRHGADEAKWPAAEDRYASDLLLADGVRDPWLQQLTLHAWSHELPIALGGHTLVGPGLGLALGIDP